MIWIVAWKLSHSSSIPVTKCFWWSRRLSNFCKERCTGSLPSCWMCLRSGYISASCFHRAFCPYADREGLAGAISLIGRTDDLLVFSFNDVLLLPRQQAAHIRIQPWCQGTVTSCRRIDWHLEADRASQIRMSGRGLLSTWNFHPSEVTKSVFSGLGPGICIFWKLSRWFWCTHEYENHGAIASHSCHTAGSETFSNSAVMRFRTGYPKIWHLGRGHIFSWRNLRKSSCRKFSLTSLSIPEVGNQILVWEKHPHIWRQRDQDESKQAGHAQLPLVYYLCSYPSVPSHFPITFHSSSNVVYKCSSLTFLEVYISLGRILCHANLVLSNNL